MSPLISFDRYANQEREAAPTHNQALLSGDAIQTIALVAYFEAAAASNVVGGGRRSNKTQLRPGETFLLGLLFSHLVVTDVQENLTNDSGV